MSGFPSTHSELEESEDTSFVFFEIRGQPYGLPATAAREVLPMLEPIPVPAWPDYALGLVNVRGELLPLVDICPLLDRHALPLSPRQFILLIASTDRTWGIVVDRIEGVRTAELQSGRDLPAAKVLAMTELCLGVVVEEGRTSVVLDPAALFRPIRLDPSPPDPSR